MNWYIRTNDGQKGPFTEQQIIETIRGAARNKEALRPDTPIRAENSDDWITLKDNALFAFELPKKRILSTKSAVLLLTLTLVGAAIIWWYTAAVQEQIEKSKEIAKDMEGTDLSAEQFKALRQKGIGPKPSNSAPSQTHPQ